MNPQVFPALATAALSLALAPAADAQDASRKNTEWLSWRGPNQDGSSIEKGLPAQVSIDRKGSWTYELPGRGTPVVSKGRVYTMGYEGEREELQEALVCVDENTGKVVWEHRFTDFLSDIIYYRFAIGSPTIDPETGNVACLSSSGELACFTGDGKLLWKRSMMAEYGRLTFPNGRTGAPLIHGELCIVHIISTSWGPHGPARDRFYAFDKKTGEPRWSSTPGGPPKDSSFSFPVVGTENGKRVLYAGLGGGHVVCLNALTGEPLWRFRLAVGGLSSSVVKYGDTIIAINGKENVDDSTIGRMVAIRCNTHPAAPGKGPVLLDRTHEVWRNDLVSFTSSPVLAGNRVFETTHEGELHCIDAEHGTKLWHLELAPDQIHASPVWGDGKLYVPMNNGSFYVVDASGKEGKILQKLQLAGNCLGAPAIAGGRIYVHTTERLYCFSGGTGEVGFATKVLEPLPAAGEAVALQVVPGDILLKTGQKVKFTVRSVDANGRVVDADVKGATWHNVPGDGVDMTADGAMDVTAGARPCANIISVEADGLRGTARVRIVPGGAIGLDFNDVALRPHPGDGHPFAFPPGYWPGAKPKWEVLELDGDKVLAKTLSNPLFQRTLTNIGHPDASNYTMTIDIRTDGNRRIMSSAGIINQRYLIALKGNHQSLEVSSNMELLKKSVKFRWKPKVWYRLKTRVDVNADGSGVIRARCWPREQEEPDAWTIEVSHSHAHRHGAPGIWGFVPQSRFRVYIDNISVISNHG